MRRLLCLAFLAAACAIVPDGEQCPESSWLCVGVGGYECTRDGRRGCEVCVCRAWDESERPGSAATRAYPEGEGPGSRKP